VRCQHVTAFGFAPAGLHFLIPVLKERLMSRSPRQSTALFRVALAALALIAVAPRPSAAQLERSTVSGTVIDQQGGVIPGVTVTAISRQTNQARSTVTDASGFYSLPQLTPGQYDVTAELDGFRRPTAPPCSSMPRPA
jgi:protocatechuate 3,4-dioxygenase beta subunit